MSSQTPTLNRLLQIKDIASLVQFFKVGAETHNLPEIDQEMLNTWIYGVNRKHLYHNYVIKKRTGGERTINAPHYKLKTAQRILTISFNEAYRPRSAVHGYVKERSIKTNAFQHQRQRCILKIDLKNFFPTIHLGRIRGLLLKPPFNLPKDVADSIARICTYPESRFESALPQGAPTSPVLSNLICRKLDKSLMDIAKEYRCFYTRYADDITFSTNRNYIPSDLAFIEGNEIEIGNIIKNVISSNDFQINNKKVRLIKKNSRQLVTGLVVNEKVNIPRTKIREIRAMLHCWKTKGEQFASELFHEKFDKKYRPPGLSKPQFRNVVIGRVRYVGYIKGKSDPVYLRFIDNLLELGVDLRHKTPDNKKLVEQKQFTLYTEGRTDGTHIKAALQHFQQREKYLDLKINYDEKANINGDAELLNFCKETAKSSHSEIKICLFDCDVDKVVKKVREETTLYKNWGNNVYSLLLPKPSFRKEHYCIEHCYKDEDLQLEDSEGHRVYLREEFNEDNGIHINNKDLHKTNHQQKTLIVDSGVFDRNTGKNIALPKSKFADYIFTKTPPFDKVNFEEFASLFKEFRKILNN